jgi:hypothetical protein
MIPFALLAVLLNSTVSVPRSHWQAIEVKIEKPNTVVECSVSVPGETARVDAIFMSRAAAERFNQGRSYTALYSTGFQTSAHFRYDVDQPGDYILMLDNRIEGRSATKVDVRIDLWSTNPAIVQTVPPRKRAIIIGLSLLFFATVAAYSARQFFR